MGMGMDMGTQCRALLQWQLGLHMQPGDLGCIAFLPIMPRAHLTFRPLPTVKLLETISEIDVGPPLFTLLQLKVSTDGVNLACPCDRPLRPTWLSQGRVAPS